MLSRTYPIKGNRFIFMFLLLFAFIFLLAGCGASNAPEQAGEQQTATKEETTSSSNSGTTKTETDTTKAEVREVEHAMGVENVPANPQKVVILTNEGTEALLALGIKPIGAVQSWTGDPWYDHIKEEMEGVTPVGLESSVNLEAIAALQPDLIIGNKMRQEEIYPQLKAIAPTVFSETLRGEWKTNFAFYAKVLNKEKEGEEVIAAFDQRIEDFKQKAGDKLSTEVSIVRFMPGRTRIYQGDSFSGIILKQIGMARPASQDKETFAEELTRERIPEMDGDIIFYFTYEKGDGEATKQEQEWLNDPLFKNLNAVKNGQVFKVDDVIWNTAGGVKAANLFLDDLSKYILGE